MDMDMNKKRVVIWTTAMKVLRRADIDNDHVEDKKYTTPLFDGTN